MGISNKKKHESPLENFVPSTIFLANLIIIFIIIGYYVVLFIGFSWREKSNERAQKKLRNFIISIRRHLSSMELRQLFNWCRLKSNVILCYENITDSTIEVYGLHPIALLCINRYRPKGLLDIVFLLQLEYINHIFFGNVS